ncbi:UvrD-helicase domain-containing protein [Mangrovimonas sp. CR14]|uniref:UvrD-helicase domain-containing protein n=1 Tax=Mangrovimonas sp. CR14 TaxID=2706120 RepID=UPI0014210CB5|nr:UvrD-helicase domain-containing protein [Mangrovimonas sp. CR14]NIK93097.1 UvrD-helicase domain-containing protein [Mangrovimonas sp. CR14]
MKNLTTKTNLTTLNDQQRKAVLSECNRLLVLAGAGSGKTKTLLHRINYLIDDKLVDAKNILAITFTKNAANEMLDRMILSVDTSGYYEKFLKTKGISFAERHRERQTYLNKFPWLNRLTIKTIHSLCYQIIKTDGVHVFDNKFKIVADQKTESEFQGSTAEESVSDIIEKVTINLSKNKEFLLKLKRYILDYFVDYIHDHPKHKEFRPEGKFFTSLKGDKVRSKSEQFIADWLYRNSIEYKYEPEVKVKEYSFHPDFFIPQANVYLEHISNKSYPSFWKERKMDDAGKTYVKTYDEATHNSAVFNSVLDRVIKGKISDDLSSATVLHYDEEFSNFRREIKRFFREVNEVRNKIVNSEKSVDQIVEEAAKSDFERVRMFYELAIPIINAFDDYCTNRSYLDFDGLLTRSIQLLQEYPHIRERYQERYKHILVDEFQDVNNLQVKLLHLLTNKEAQLFCVGDDWQSIYGFRGSEISYIVNFKKHFNNSELLTLNLNYRSTDPIVSASTEAIKKNKFQIPKEIKAVKRGGQKIKVFYEEQDGQTNSFIWETIEKHIAEGVNPEDILVLYRRSAMATDLKQALKSSGHKIQFKTIHSAKGLEAKVVFILGLHSNKGGFPDPWLQDKIYQVIKPTDYDYLLEEERRLFYVALTRAEDHLYLISQKGAVSDFIRDIPSEFLYQNESKKDLATNSIVLCVNCDSKLEDHYKFCPQCGGKIVDENIEPPLLNEKQRIEKLISVLPITDVDGDEQKLKARKKNKRAYESWSAKEDNILKECYGNFSIKQLSKIFGRSFQSIKLRMKFLELE